MIDLPLRNENVIRPPQAHDFSEMLAQANNLLAFMASESLDVVAALANELAISARSVGAAAIATAAERVHRIAGSHAQLTLTAAMNDLTRTVERANAARAAEHA